MARREALGKGIGALFSDQEKNVKTPDLSVITNEPEVISRKSEVETSESLVITNNSEVVSKETDMKTSDSSVITNESEVNSKKLEVNTFEPPVITNESEVISRKSGVITLGKKTKDQKQRSGNRVPKKKQRFSAIKTKQMIEVVDQEILEQSITEALESPRISTWSPLVMSALRYLQLTTTRFSMSKEVSETLETAFKEKYPELLDRIKKELEER